MSQLPDVKMPNDDRNRERIDGIWYYDNYMTGKPFRCRVTDPKTTEQWNEEVKLYTN